MQCINGQTSPAVLALLAQKGQATGGGSSWPRKAGSQVAVCSDSGRPGRRWSFLLTQEGWVAGGGSSLLRRVGSQVGVPPGLGRSRKAGSQVGLIPL